MATSQNGWSAYSDPAKFGGLTTVTVGPVSLGIRKGDVATVLGYFMEQFHKRVEPLRKGQCGCFNYRNIRGSTTGLSNHASASALDLNWNLHVQHKRNTFTSAQVKEIRKILAECSGVIRWGGDYSNPDEMHFEINANASKVKAAAAKLKSRPAPTPPTIPVIKPGQPDKPPAPNSPPPGRTITYMKLSATVPVLKQGDNDDKLKGSRLITRIQLIVGADHDGVWGPNTTARIAAFTKLPVKDCSVLTEKVWRAIFGVAA